MLFFPSNPATTSLSNLGSLLSKDYSNDLFSAIVDNASITWSL